MEDHYGFTPVNMTYKQHFRPFFLLGNSPLEGCQSITYNDGEVSAPVRAIYSALSIVSMISSIFIAITIFYNPKLRIHPSKLIGYMAICEALSCFNALIWAINPLDFICYFGLHYMFNWTTFGRSLMVKQLQETILDIGHFFQLQYVVCLLTIILYSQSRVDSLIYLCQSNQVVFSYFQTVSLCFNFCLCHDLVQTLQNPFYPGKRRMKFYFMGSIAVAALFSIFSRKNLQDKCNIIGEITTDADDYVSQQEF